MRTVVPLTAVERAVLSDFAEGSTPAQIVASGSLSMDKVNGILVTRASMSRKRAAALVAEPDPAESPLTAPIRPAHRGDQEVTPERAKQAPPKPPAPAERPAEPVGARAQSAPPASAAELKPPLAPTAEALLAVAPSISDDVAQLLDEGINAIADKLRELLPSLVATAVEQQRAAIRRRRVDWVAELEAQLDVVRAELAELDGGAR